MKTRSFWAIKKSKRNEIKDLKASIVQLLDSCLVFIYEKYLLKGNEIGIKQCIWSNLSIFNHSSVQKFVIQALYLVQTNKSK